MLSYHPTSKTPDVSDGFLTAERIGQVIKSHIWSGIVWKDGKRRKSHFLFSDWCVLDFDSGEVTLKEATKLFCDCIHVIGTTRNHKRAKHGITCDRFRVAIPWERRIEDTLVYEHNMRVVAKNYPVDQAPVDGARIFFPCHEITSVCVEGYKQDVHELPEGYGKPAQAVDESCYGTGVLPRYIQTWLLTPAAPGTIRVSLYKIGAELGKWGMSLEESIYLAQHSATATSGVMTSRDPLAEIADCVANGWKKNRLA